MLYFIHPEDETTSFLAGVYASVIDCVGSENVQVINFRDVSCNDNFELVKRLPGNAQVFFLGHGRNDRLYGVHEESNEPFVESNKMWVFDGKSLFALACHSSELLSKSHGKTNIIQSIGFGNLPTSTEEAEEIKKIRSLDISEDDLEEFKAIIVECVSQSIVNLFNTGGGFEALYYHLRLLLNKRINSSVLEKKNRNLAELIFQMYSQMTYLKSL